MTPVDPRTNAVVHAAAGTGKTWLLVSRLVRLLLEGAAPSSILAITFTRKAAAEMRVRLNQRLLTMCEASDATLDAMLRALDLIPDAATQQRARRLYEEVLTAPHALRATTFHAFCQELLARFAFEAGVPPTFAVAEFTNEIEAKAWRALDRDLRDDDSPVTQAMERLLRSGDGVEQVRRTLSEFLVHRGDWWAYIEDQPDPVAHAQGRLRETLGIDPDADSARAFAAHAENHSLVQALVATLGDRVPPSLQATCKALKEALTADRAADFYHRVHDALYTQDKKKPREFKMTKALASAIGATDADALIARHRLLLERVQRTEEQLKREETMKRNRDWYLVGARLLHHFQEQKRAAGLLDFADLEWLAYRLLNRSRHAHWIQYKLDQRIDHLLVDEFQDTNPTQWRLLLPLLEEMAAGGERVRSVFLVGDEKQSIYRFRRADPALFALAQDWLTAFGGARVDEQHVSWRSSPAIVHCVNLLFDANDAGVDDGNGPLKYRLPRFRTHATHRTDLWGHAELLPLVVRETASRASPDFRSPLEQPRVVEEDRRRRREGDLIAAKIHALIGRPIRDGDTIRGVRYGDIMILLRARTYASHYEAALRHAGIPYAGAGRGNFLDCLEVRDMVALLKLLLSPFEDVPAATVLRCPIFAASDDDLLALAAVGHDLSWYERLIRRHANDPRDTPLGRAARLLPAWRDLADRIPVHDLLDRIYFEADVSERYESAAPPHLRARVAANLTRLLELALEADAGRFPSLARFLSRLQWLTEEDNESLGAGAQPTVDQVRLLTIHGAKGLEAPVVFLADAARDVTSRERGLDVLVDWPIDQSRPANFLLGRHGSDADDWSRGIAERQAAKAFQEETNLLYVALTRAQQYLYVSGCESGRRKDDGPGRAGDETRGWYGWIERRFAQALATGAGAAMGLQVQTIAHPNGGEPINLCGSIVHGSAPLRVPEQSPLALATSVDPVLTRPFAGDSSPDAVIDPNGAEPTPLLEWPAAKRRGVIIHRMLERLTTPEVNRERARLDTWHEYHSALDADTFDACWREACAVIDAPDLAPLFDHRDYDQARNEVVVLYESDGEPMTGVIDRLLIAKDKLTLIDYKTDRVKRDGLPDFISRHTPQLRRYADAVRRLWPGRSIEAILLLTQSRWLARLDV